jgi:CBS domain-containing protein
VSPRTITDELVREAPSLSTDTPVGEAVRQVLDSGLPALPVVGDDGLCGIFGEREFITALFPKYLGELNYAGFVKHALDEALEKRQSCRGEPVSQHMNTEHIDVGADYSDVEIAETFLHHRVLIIPVTDGKRVVGVITRSEFFRALAERFLEAGGSGP